MIGRDNVLVGMRTVDGLDLRHLFCGFMRVFTDLIDAGSEISFQN
jgi:hypothetical protein